METSNSELKSFLKASNGEESSKEMDLNLYMKKKSMTRYKINLKLKLPKSIFETIGTNVRTNMINKKNDKTFIMDILSK